MKNEDLLKYIGEITETEIGEVLDAVLERYRVLYPEWEVNMFVLPSEPGEKRRKQFEDIVQFIRKYGGIY